MALLVLLDAFFQNRGPDGLLAVTVDHGLRAASAAEAEAVAAFCASRGIPHRTLRWSGDKPATGIPAAAREMRHRLLAEAAVSAGASMVLTGHTANDQAETVAMRARRGSGRGLAGIAPATLYDGRVWFVRPILGCTRAALRTMLVDAGISWIDDPTNEMIAYERARARQAMSGPDEGDIVAALVERGRRAAAERVDTGRRAAVLVDRHARLPVPGLVAVDAGLFAAEDVAAARLALRLLIAAVGGREHLPNASRSCRVFERLASGPGRCSLGGAVVDRRKGTVYLHRELRAGWTGTARAEAGAVWDGRFRIGPDRIAENAMVEALGRAEAVARARAFPQDAGPPALVRAALAAEPILHVRGAGAELERQDADPGAGTLVRVAAPHARYLPLFDLAAAESLRRLFGGARFPVSPCDSHNAG